jgi:glycosyltransferase involved in cell wall biosynthesis
MQRPKVSIIVPTYNQSQYLPACLDSIFFQDYPNLEIIVVNDGSTDKTREFLSDFRLAVSSEQVSYASYFDDSNQVLCRTEHKRFRESGRELKIFHHEKNIGSTPTYNHGFQQATGTYCTYVASDDMCHPSMISTLVEALEDDIADFVYSDMFIVDDANRILREFRLPDYSFKACFEDWYLCGVSKLYRRSLHETFGYYNEQYLANDHELYLRFAMNGVRFKHIPKVLYSVRSHERRDVDVHSPSNWSRLIKESIELVGIARRNTSRKTI